MDESGDTPIEATPPAPRPSRWPRRSNDGGTAARGPLITARTAIAGTVLAALAASGVWIAHHPPVQGVGPGEIGVRANRITGSLLIVPEGSAVCIPGLHELRRISVRNQVFRSTRSARATSEAPFKSSEGLSIGAELVVEYAVDPAKVEHVARALPEDLGHDVIEPAVDGLGHRLFAEHTVREIFASQRAQLQTALEDELRKQLEPQGLLLRSVSLGSIDLPSEYREGLERLLGEELASDRMKFTLELKEKQIKQTELEAEARKVAREKDAEAAAQEEITAAKAHLEAMNHLLPLKEKEIEQQRLESEAERVHRIKTAETEAQARGIEADAEANTRRKLAEADAYRIEVTGKAQSEQMARDSALIARNPLLIQKTVADKLSDKIQVIVAPPPRAGFFAEGLLQTGKAPAPIDSGSTNPEPPKEDHANDQSHDDDSEGGAG